MATAQHAQATKADLASVRVKADPQLAGYLDAVGARYAKPSTELPMAFWPTAITLP